MGLGGFFEGLGKAALNGIPGSDTRKVNDAGAASKQAQAQADQLKEQQDLRNQQNADEDYANHIQQLGGKFVHNNTVKDDLPMPDGTVQPGGLLRKADPERIVKHKTADGETIQWELPTTDSQIARAAALAQQQQSANAPVRATTAAETATNTQNTERAKLTGEGQGKTAAAQEDLSKRGIPLGPGEAASYGLPEATTAVTPETASGLSKVITPANIRSTGLKDRTQIQADQRASTAQAVQQMKDAQEQEKLTHQDAWNRLTNQTRSSIATQGESGKNSRTMQRIGVDQKLHGQALDQAYQEEQKQLQAQALIDEKTEPGAVYGTNTTQATPDGQDFIDPFSGKKMTMNYGQRLRLKNALQASQAQSAALRARAGDIATKYNLTNPGDGIQAQPGTQPAAAAVAPVKPPAGAKFKVGQTVYDKAGKPHKVTGYDASGKMLVQQ